MSGFRLLAVGLLACVVSPAFAQVPPEKAVGTFTVSPGLEATLWASEPLFVNPTSMDVDHKGRVWVCEAVNYRAQIKNRPDGDRIMILEDTKGEGKADRATVFYQAKDFISPLGIAVAKDPVGPGYKVFICHSPNIYVLEDKEGKGVADGPPKVLISGFGGYNHDHGVHGILIGPDNKLYFTVGDTGVSKLKDKNGKIWSSNSTDCRAGTTWRCDLDGSNLELIAHNFRNNYEPCVDSFGTVFLSDNDDDGNQQTRICYVMPGGNYGYHPRGPGQSHWHEEQPGVVPKILRTYFGSPCGICVYEGKLLPEKYQGQLLHVDAGPRHLRCYHLTADGAGFAVEREDMITSTDNWFRPSDVCVAPDGAVFVADWYDPGVGGHGMGDTTRGRIFRVAPKGNKPVVPKVDLDTKEGLHAALASPCLAVRYMAMAKIQELTPTEALRVLEPAVEQKDNVWLRARALWMISKHRTGPVLDALNDKDERFRVLALRILKRHHNSFLTDFPNMADFILGDPSSAVRREVLLLLQDVAPEKAKPLIVALMKKYDGKDKFYLCAVGIAVGQDKARRDVLLADFEKTFPDWSEQVAGLVWELRPPSILASLEKRLADPKVPGAQKAQIIDILGSTEDATGAKALLQVLLTDVPADVRARVVENLKQSLPGKWRSLRTSKEVAEGIDNLLAKAETRVDGLVLVAAAEKNDLVGKVAALAGDAKEKPEVRIAAVAAIGAIPSNDAVAALEKLVKADAAIRAEVIAGLGKAAQRDPKQPPTAAAVKVLQELLLDKAQDNPTRLAAGGALTGSRLGTVWLLEAESRKEVPDALRPDIGRLLRNTPYQDLRNKALVAFPPPAKIDPKKLPQIADLMKRTGNPEHGKQLLATTFKNDLACLKCHTVRGQGGQVGPDLSVIGKKASRDNLFESILLPSKAIADQYLTWAIETKAGGVVSGLLIEETPEYVLIRDANAKDTKIAKKDIESRAKSPISIMPDNLLAFMTEDDLVDMVDYLFSLKTPALAVDRWHAAGPFLNQGGAGLDQTFAPEKSVDLKATYQGKTGPVAWKEIKPTTTGFIDLAAAFGPSDAKDSVVFLYREIDSPVDQDATVLLGTDEPAKLWLNGQLVHTNTKKRNPVPEDDQVKVRLKKGSNQVLFKLTNTDGPFGAFFTVLAEQELKVLVSK